MPKFLVYVDKAEPYEVEHASVMAATVQALDKHPAADRVEVRPVRQRGRDPVFMRRVSDNQVRFATFDEKGRARFFNPTMGSTVTEHGLKMPRVEIAIGQELDDYGVAYGVRARDPLESDEAYRRMIGDFLKACE